jgi:murein DD-endopeptidase MepM/ murein hydrolase activator NlpD
MVGAVVSIWGLPKRPAPLPRDTQPAGAPALPLSLRDTIRRGEGVVAALTRIGLTRSDAALVLEASETRATARRDIPIAFYADSANAPVREVEFQIADDRSIRVLRVSDTAWTAVERRELWKSDTVTLRGPVTGSLVESLRNAGRGSLSVRGRLEAAYAIAEAFEYKLDVGRDLVREDSVVAIVERRRTAFGAEQIGPLVAGALYHGGEWLRAIRFTLDGRAEYFDEAGRPMRTSFLTAPVEFRRMSSAFGIRVHPILGTVRRHAGIDFAAPLGTPVRSVGDGAVIRAGFAGGFGKLIEIRHRDGMVTRYGHLRGFSPGIREGLVVTQGQVIGFVGSTGLSTGPHLHFETLVNGTSTEPTRTLRKASGVSVPATAQAAFAVSRDAVMQRLTGSVSAAVRSAPATVAPSNAPVGGAAATQAGPQK